MARISRRNPWKRCSTRKGAPQQPAQKPDKSQRKGTAGGIGMPAGSCSNVDGQEDESTKTATLVIG